MGLVEIFRSRLKAIQKLYAHLHEPMFWGVCVFLDICLEEIVFLKGLVKFREITNIEDLIKS